jgi:aldehyde dehydrogenase
VSTSKPASSEGLVADIVQTVLGRLESEGLFQRHGVAAPAEGVYDRVDDAIRAAQNAQRSWERTPKETKRVVLDALRQSMHDNAEEFSRRELQETGLGRFEDKVMKQHNAADATPGLEVLESRSWSGDKGLVVEEYAPYGVIAAVTPSTHPTAVMLNSAMMIIAPGNSVVFNVHPGAKSVSAYALGIFNRTVQKHGGPAGLLTMVREPTLESARELFTHPSIRLIAATGGPGLVRAACASGKKVIAAGPGNPPVLVDETADLDAAARTIIEGASFDNNILCIAEKEVFVVGSAFEGLMEAFQRHGAVRLGPRQVEALVSKVFSKNEKGETVTSREYIGKNPSVLARAAGVDLPDSVRLLVGEGSFDCPFVQEEQMMPYLPVVRVKDIDEGIALAFKAEHGYGHTAMIHSRNIETITRYCRRMNTTIVVVNGSSLAGNGGMAGEGYFSHTIASPTGEGVCTPRNFARVRRMSVAKDLRIV